MPDTLLVDYEKLRTPPNDMGVLIEPPAPALTAAIEADHDARLADVPLLTTTIGALRRHLRDELELAGSVVMTGHQPEFVHAGVLAKTIANQVLAREVGGQAVFLIADSDVPREASIAVPHVADGVVTLTRAALPGVGVRLPAESQRVVPRAEWQACFARIADLLPKAEETLLPAFAGAWLASEADELDYCEAMRRAHGAVEAELGLDGVRTLRMSELAGTAAFMAFASHLMVNARECATRYNNAVRVIRERRRVRNPQRPVPPLVIEGERVEVPLWLQRPGNPRGRMFVVPERGTLAVYADDQRVAALDISTLATRVPDSGTPLLDAGDWQLRPRALTLSCFVRLFLADLFIHGIGGAKYDEVTELFTRGFFGVDAPPMCAVSATMHLPLPSSGTTRDDVRRARHAVRDLRFNPQRHMKDLPPRQLAERAALIEQSATLRQTQRQNHAQRRRVFERIRALNTELLASSAATRDTLVRQAHARESQWRQDSLARGREYFFALHSRTKLMSLVETLRAKLAT